MDSLIDRSIAILSEAEGAASSDLAWALYVKGASLGGTDLIRSDSLLVRAVDLIESDARPDTAALAAFYHTKAGKAGARGDFEAQERDLHKALAFAVAAHGERHTRVFAIQRGLAQFYAQRMDREGARRHADEALRLARVIFPADHPSVGLALETHGEALYIEGKLEESAAAQEQALAILQTSYSHDHPNQAWILYVLGYIYRDLGRLDLAIERMRASADMRARLHGATSTRAGDALFGVAELLGKAGYHERADSTFRAALVLLEPLVAAAPHHVASMYAIYANYCRDLGRFSEAESLYTLSAKKGECGSCVADHAYLRSLRGQHAAAESLMHVGMAILENEGNAHSLRGAHLMWAVVRAKAGDADGTIEALERAARAGVDAKQVAQYPELVALRSRPDYPAALRAATPDTASSRPAS
jgi:tetratricopeptide (TPR) repeat protein